MSQIKVSKHEPDDAKQSGGVPIRFPCAGDGSERHRGAIAHMAPSLQSVAPAYAERLTSAAYASRLEELAQRADLWVHGHMHDSFDYALGRCRVVCNPCGYMTRGGGVENPRFDPNFVVDVG